MISILQLSGILLSYKRNKQKKIIQKEINERNISSSLEIQRFSFIEKKNKIKKKKK